jgi:hypothetical protein
MSDESVALVPFRKLSIPIWKLHYASLYQVEILVKKTEFLKMPFPIPPAIFL